MTSYFNLLPLPVRWNEGRSGSPTNVDKIVDLLLCHMEECAFQCVLVLEI